MKGRVMHRLLCLSAFVASLIGSAPAIAADAPLEGVRRVVFLGDSITYSGQYIEFLETFLRLKDPTLRCEFLNLGLPSETVSGLTEPGHAGGAFPRPDLHERLNRILANTKPDLVIACYGMNDGIYHPFGEERFRKFQEGIQFLRDRVTATGAKILHLTPPVFDPVPIRERTLPAGLAEYRQPYEGYDQVLDRYSEWLLARRADGWDVIDVHGPMKRYLVEQRRRDPMFRLAGDGVHINAAGHWIIARQVLDHWKVLPPGTADPARILDADPRGQEILALVQKKQRLLKDTWLTATGHTRPGMRPGLPFGDVNRKAAELDAEIRKRLASKP
jgi:lysophospholipase L1-like esterase